MTGWWRCIWLTVAVTACSCSAACLSVAVGPGHWQCNPCCRVWGSRRRGRRPVFLVRAHWTCSCCRCQPECNLSIRFSESETAWGSSNFNCHSGCNEWQSLWRWLGENKEQLTQYKSQCLINIGLLLFILHCSGLHYCFNWIYCTHSTYWEIVPIHALYCTLLLAINLTNTAAASRWPICKLQNV